MTNGYWSPAMQEKHEQQIAAHVAKRGPLGELTKAGKAKLARMGVPEQREEQS